MISNEIDLIVTNSACKICAFAHALRSGEAGHETWSFTSSQTSILLMKLYILVTTMSLVTILMEQVVFNFFTSFRHAATTCKIPPGILSSSGLSKSCAASTSDTSFAGVSESMTSSGLFAAYASASFWEICYRHFGKSDQSAPNTELT